MNCTEIKLHVHDYSAAILPQPQQIKVEQHLIECCQCSKFYDEYTHLQTLLSKMPRPKASEELHERILMKQAKQHQEFKQQIPNRKKSGYKIAMASGAIAASIVFTIILSTLMNDDLRSEAANQVANNQSQIVAALNKPSQVNFLVNAKHAVDNVIFSLNVPPELELYGYTGKQTLSWSGKLKKGKNLLTIPVVALTHHSATLVMEIKHNDAVKEYKVLVDVKQNNVGTQNTTITPRSFFMLS